MAEMQEPVTHVLVEKTCFHCQGKGRVPGGQIEYGEVIPCPVCNGRCRTKAAVTLREFADLLLRAVT